jgi:hypothetical protein
MFSSHEKMALHKFATQHFPDIDYLRIPPENQWVGSRVGCLYYCHGHYISWPKSEDLICINAYDTPGILALTCSHTLEEHPYTRKDALYHITGTFSRVDIATLVTALKYGMSGQFVPQNVGMPFSAFGYEKTSKKKQKANP